MPRTTQDHRNPSPVLTIAQTAKLLQCSQPTVRRMIERGELRAYRYGQRVIRIDPRDIEKMRRPVTPTADYVAARGSGAA